MNFTPAKPRGHFNPKAPMYVVKRFWGINPGQLCPKASASRKRVWWRRGWIANEDQLSKEELAHIKKLNDDPGVPPEVVEEFEQAMGEPDENVPETGTKEQDENEPQEDENEGATPVSAEEGKKGWWVVTFSDETTKKMRRDDVIALGLLEEVTDGEEV